MNDQPAHDLDPVTPPAQASPECEADEKITLPYPSAKPAKIPATIPGETIGYAGADTIPASIPADMPRQAGRFRLKEELGRGGMGAVLRALDPDLLRPLAVKIMLPQLSGNPEAAERFLLEARLTGQLQHPGIPPVHELGRLDDGRPFFAMKLIQGRTLASILHGKAASSQDLAAMLGIFTQVCQTLAYAHSQGVIHRDLKPQNVMVGAFGEVQLMDWGLAKVLEHANLGLGENVAAHAGKESARRDRGPLVDTINFNTPRLDTNLGDVLGTPAYLAPEQARGEIEDLDERCDVFGLGGILCVILTGQPPFPFRGGQSPQAMDGDLTGAFERLRQCGADEELVDLARRCLAPRKEDRLKNGGEVAEAMTAYQARVRERLQQAELERQRAEVQALEERKRRRVWLGLAAAVLALIVAGAGVALWYVNDRAQRQAEDAARQTELEGRILQVNREVKPALDEADALLKNLRTRLDDPQQVHVLLSAMGNWKNMLASAEHALKRAKVLAQGQESLLEPGTMGRLQALAGRLQDETENYGRATELDGIRQDASALVEGKFNVTRTGARYAAYFSRQQVNVAQVNLEQAAAHVKSSPLRYVLVAALDHWAEANDYQDNDRSLMRRLLHLARRADPDPWRDRFRQLDAWYSVSDLSSLKASLDLPRQSPHIIISLAFRLKAVGQDPVPLLRSALLVYPGDFWLHFHLANQLQEPAARAAHIQAALTVRPESSVAYNNLAVALYDQKDWAGAAQACRKALELAPEYGLAYNNLGNILRRQKDLKGALDACRTAVKLEPKLAGAYYSLGLVLHDRNDLEGACTAYNQAIDLDRHYLKANINLGNALAKQKKQKHAIDAYNKAIALDKSHSRSYYNMGVVLQEMKDLTGADAAYRKCIALEPKFAQAHCNLGQVLREQGEFEKALHSLERGHELGSAQPGWKLPSSQWLAEHKKLLIVSRLEKLEASPHEMLRAGLQGQLAKHDPLDIFDQTAGSFRKSHGALLKAGQAYQIDLAGAFDTFLRVEDALFQTLLFNDDKFPPDELSSRLVFTPTKDGIYRLVVTSANAGATGAYTLKIQEVAPAANPHILKGSLTKNHKNTKGKFFQVHQVELTAGLAHSIELESRHFDTYLLLVDPRSKKILAQNDDISPGNTQLSRLDVTPDKTASYNLVVTTFQPGEIGPYTLRVQSYGPKKEK